jgi:ferredoxin
MAGLRFISEVHLHQLLTNLSESYDVYVPVKKNEERTYARYAGATNGLCIGEVRPSDPLKAFFFRPREQVAEGYEPAAPSRSGRPICVVGAKACDLKGFKVQDYVFADHDFRDPAYADARESNLIIAADCTCAIDTCFCLSVDVKPYPQSDFDLALSPVTGGFVVEVGSEKGEELVTSQSSLFGDAPSPAQAERDAQRTDVAGQVESNIVEHGVPRQEQLDGAMAQNFESEIWADEANTCVECGACNTICPTCHCFLLYDQQDSERMARFRMWDSCLIKDFARVAGGANPRPQLWMRLRNRFEKKFDYFPKVAGLYACTGCGRCISACPAKIDIRRVLKRLVTHG